MNELRKIRKEIKLTRIVNAILFKKLMTQAGCVFYRKSSMLYRKAQMLYAEHNILRSDLSCTLFLIQQLKDSTTETSFLNKKLKLVLRSKINMPEHSERRAARLRNTCLREDKNDIHLF